MSITPFAQACYFLNTTFVWFFNKCTCSILYLKECQDNAPFSSGTMSYMLHQSCSTPWRHTLNWPGFPNIIQRCTWVRTQVPQDPRALSATHESAMGSVAQTPWYGCQYLVIQLFQIHAMLGHQHTWWAAQAGLQPSWKLILSKKET